MKDAPMAIRIACTAEMDALSGDFSPMRRATIAVVAVLKPMPMA